MTRNRSDDDWTVTHSYDSGSDEPSSEVVRAVAVATDRDVRELDPLYESVETDALDALLDRDAEASAAFGPRLSFSYAGCRVIADDERVVVRPDDAA